MNREPVIETSRLELHHLTGQEMVSLFEEPEADWIYEGKNFSNPYRHLMDDSGPLAWRVPQIKTNPAVNKWFLRWIVRKDSREIIGSTSFHRAPDEAGMIEIGLAISSQFQSHGFGYEALLGMWRWACTFPEVRTLRYTVSADNLASIVLIKKFGFAHVGQQLDEIDGPEEIYELSVQDFRAIAF